MTSRRKRGCDPCRINDAYVIVIAVGGDAGPRILSPPCT